MAKKCVNMSKPAPAQHVNRQSDDRISIPKLSPADKPREAHAEYVTL
jgi:hypothetical protein